MKKSCVYCGKVHEISDICRDKRKVIDATAKVRKENGTSRRCYKDVNSKEYKLYNSKKWKLKRNEIVKRDLYLCQSCLHIMVDEYGLHTLNGNDLEVHHIAPLKQDWDKRLDSYNLITLCRHCHRMAEDDDISADVLLEIVRKNEEMGCCIPLTFDDDDCKKL